MRSNISPVWRHLWLRHQMVPLVEWTEVLPVSKDKRHITALPPGCRVFHQPVESGLTYYTGRQPVAYRYGLHEWKTVRGSGYYYLSRAMAPTCHGPVVLVGTDPELELVKNGAIVYAGDFVRDPDRVKPVGLDGCPEVVELRPSPVPLALYSNLVKEVRRLILKASKITGEICISTFNYPTGCHIHLGASCRCHTFLSNHIIGDIDEVLGEWYVIRKRVRGSYAVRQSTETKSYGFEYRTLPALILLNEELFGLVLEVIRCLVYDLPIHPVVTARLEWYFDLARKIDKLRIMAPPFWGSGWAVRFRRWLADSSIWRRQTFVEFSETWEPTLRRDLTYYILERVPFNKVVRLYGLADWRGLVWTGPGVELPSGLKVFSISHPTTFPESDIAVGLPWAYRAGRLEAEDQKALTQIVVEHIAKMLNGGM